MGAVVDLGMTMRWFYSSFSALDMYHRRSEQNVAYITVVGDLITLARAVPDLEFPGVAHADAAAFLGHRRVYFRCFDEGAKPRPQTFRSLNLLYDAERERYVDPYDDYPALRSGALEPTAYPHEPLERLMDAAIAVSRYPQSIDSEALPRVERFAEQPPESLRTTLGGILTGTTPWEGLKHLKSSGFVQAYWPELARMDGTSHTKEHHPEGDVWTHSLETFRYRRSNDLVLTLALLLHDAGKPEANPVGPRKFDRHTEIGAKLAARFLRRLEFPDETIRDVCWLVENHMYPGALHRLPTFRTARLMSNELFPLLLELYRCDLESTYRGPEGYYRACKIYRDFLRNSANPFRSVDGKKLVRLYVD